MKSLFPQSLAILLASSIAAHAAGNDWMSCLDGDLPISQLSIPGTHDSAALVEPFPGTARTQTFPLDQQLGFGVRFLDIRCRHENDQFNIYHGIVPQGINFDVVLLQVNNFLDANPGEAVIMSVKEEHTPQNNTRSFEATFDFYVAQNPTRWMLGDHTPTLGEARNHIVLFRRFGASSTPKGIDASSFPDNTDFTTGNRLRVQDRYVVSNNNDKWKAIRALLGEAKHGGPNTLYVNFCSGYQEIEFGLPNITSVSDDINVRLADYFTQNTSGQFGTILMDFADANKTELIYRTNLEIDNAVHRPAFFSIVNRNSGKAIDLIAGSTSNGAQINQWDHDAGQNQRWALAPSEDGDHFRITSWHSSRCFNIEGNSTSPGAKLLSSQHNNGDNPSQHFDLIDAGDGFFKIRNVRSNLILEVQNSDTGNNARIQQNTDSGAANQQWRLQLWGDYRIRTSSGNYLTTDGSAIAQQAWQEHPSNEWSFVSSGNGYLKAEPITDSASAISIPGSATSTGIAAEALPAGGQNLRIEPQTDGGFRFYFVHSGFAWEASSGELQQNTASSAAEQTFQLERPSSFAATLPNVEHGWRCDHFALADILDPAKEATVWGRDANPDGDEWSNFEEFAFGGDPNDAMINPATGIDYRYIPATDSFTASFTRLSSGVLDYKLQTSINLVQWDNTTTTEASVTTIDSLFESVRLTDEDASKSSERRFVKVRVTE